MLCHSITRELFKYVWRLLLVRSDCSTLSIRNIKSRQFERQEAIKRNVPLWTHLSSCCAFPQPFGLMSISSQRGSEMVVRRANDWTRQLSWQQQRRGVEKTTLCQAKGELEDRSLWQYLPVNFALSRYSSVRDVQWMYLREDKLKKCTLK